MTDSLQTRFRALDIQLWQTRAFWQPVPFRDPRPAWMSSHPDLAAALLGLTDTEYERLSAGGDTLTQWLSTWLPEASSLATLSALPALQGPALPGWPFGFDRDIPGRKWRQIEAFAACLLPPDGQRLVDWCAGKGHLTRAAALVTGLPAVGLERDPVLCTAGETLARRHGLAVSLTGLDVMTEDVRQHVDAASHCIALHACGDLHLRLMDVAAACSAPALCFSPCCYHKGRPPSGLNPDLSQLSPDADMLRLAVQETVTAKGYERRQRELEALWRQAVEACWDALGLPERPRHTPLPPAEFRGTFTDFCLRRLTDAGVTAPRLEPERLQACLAEGASRLARLRRLELLRQAWRRPIEVWLCLDRAVWLERRGYAVEVGTFCDASLTPRNILLRASRLTGREYPCADGPV
jgi:hypothetical protein